MVSRSTNSLRHAGPMEDFGPRFGEYPVSLMTRRAYGLRADEVIDRRANAPNHVELDPRWHPESLESRGE